MEYNIFIISNNHILYLLGVIELFKNLFRKNRVSISKSDHNEENIKYSNNTDNYKNMNTTVTSDTQDKFYQNEMKKFDLNIEKVLENWEVYHALREIIANALDEQKLTNTKEIKIYNDNKGSWHIRDFGRGIKYQYLTQNENVEKLENDDLIGKFGVGLKDALATFYRHNVKVYIKSKYGDVTIGQSEKYGFDDILTLHAYISKPSDDNFIGTDFIITGCTTDDIEKAKLLFLRFSGERVVETTQYGQVINSNSNTASIYMNGVKVANESNFLFSYNITSLTKKIKKELNRERTNIGRSAYTDRVKSILLNCKSEEIAKKISQDLVNSSNNMAHDEIKWKDVAIHACKIVNSLKDVVFVSSEDLINNSSIVQDVVNFSKSEVVTIPEYIKQEISGQNDISGNSIVDIKKVIDDKNREFQYNFVEYKNLTETEKSIIDKTNEILNMINIIPKNVKKIKISENMKEEVLDYAECLGNWDLSTGTIIIKRSQLESIKKYAGVVLHEICHAISGAGDSSRQFENSLTDMIGILVLEASDLLQNEKKQMK